MALNETTGIDPAIDRFVIKSVSSGNVLNFNATWPRFDGGPLVGANPDLQYYKKVANAQPDIDHRYELQSADVFTLTTPAPAEGLPVGTFGTTYTPVRRELNDLLAQIESEYQRQVRLQFPETENPSTIIQVGGILIKQQAGSVLTAAEEALIVAFVATKDKIAQLATRRGELMTAAENDQDYDLTVWPVLS
jgi:hypothetical protein